MGRNSDDRTTENRNCTMGDLVIVIGKGVRPLFCLAWWRWGVTVRVWKARCTVNGNLYSSRQHFVTLKWD